MVETAEGVSGPYCGKILSILGAEVLKIERPLKGDRSRNIGPFLSEVNHIESSALFLYNNTGKKSLVIDLETVEGMEQLDSLVYEADVLIEDWDHNYRLTRNLKPNRFTSTNSSLIDISITPFGLTGPYAQWKSSPLVQLALGGYLYLTGNPGQEPLMLPGYQPDYLTGLNAHNAVEIALLQRDFSGHGSFLELSTIETLASLHQFTMEMETYSGLVRTRNGHLWQWQGQFANSGITTLPCKDGHVCFGVSTEDQWERLCLMLQREDLLTDPDYDSRAKRRERSDILDNLIIEWMKDKSKQEAFLESSELWQLPTAPLLSMEEVVADPQFQGRSLFKEINHPVAGTAVYPVVPFETRTINPVVARAPLMGEHDSFLERKPITKQENSHPRTHNSQQNKPDLSHIRILDLTRVWAGPLATRILGDFGAHIIKISDPRVPERTDNGLHNKLNRNKESLGLRLDLAYGRQIFLDLVSICDVVIENFRPRVMRNLSLTYDDLKAVNPQIIQCSMPGFGLTGPYAEFPAFGPSAESLAGVPSLMGYSTGNPVPTGIAYADPVSALNTVGIVTSALRNRNKTGNGEFIDIALAAGPVCTIGEFIVASSSVGHTPDLDGNRLTTACPHGAYKAKGEDNWVAISVSDEEEWAALVGLIGDDRIGSEEMTAFENRKSQQDLIDNILSEWMATKDPICVTKELQGKGIPAGPVSNNRQLLKDPHLLSRDFFVELYNAPYGCKKYDGQSIPGNFLDKKVWAPARSLGTDNKGLIVELLGHSPQEYENLLREKVIGFQNDSRH